ncbi:hypothetical protein KKC59_01165 [bacterium]|nr:hypothetical protein [bacterium]
MKSEGRSTKKPIKTDYITLIIIAIIGFTIAFYRFGWTALNPTNIDWLMQHGDSATYYLGWQFLRNESWHFPLGIIKEYIYPIGACIGYTDSLPLLAFPFKLISFILPKNFQYFGLWLFASHILQGIFGYLLTNIFTQKRWIKIIGSVFFLLSPIMLFRVGHIVLAGHWIILAGFWVYFSSKTKYNWILTAIAGLIHPYIGIMVLAILIAGVFKEWLFTKKLSLTQSLVFIFGLPCLLIFCWWITGYFYFKDLTYADGGFGFFSMNLNSFFNTMGSSRLFPYLKFQSGQYEGFSYTGTGMAILIPLAFILMLFDSFKGNFKKQLLTAYKHIPLIIICIVFLIIAISSNLTWGEKTLFSINLGQGILFKIANIFRSSGRFIWPIYYAIFFITLSKLTRRLPDKILIIVLSLGLIIQISDLTLLKPNILKKYKFEKHLTDPSWEKLAKQFDKIITAPPYELSMLYESDFKDFGYLAVTNKIPITTGYSARSPRERIEKLRKEIDQKLLSKELDSNTLYVFTRNSLKNYSENLKNIAYCHKLDSFIICYSKSRGQLLDKQFDLNEPLTLLSYLKYYEDKLIIICAQNSLKTSLTAELKNYLETKKSRINQLQEQGSYIAILYKGSILNELLNNNGALKQNWQSGSKWQYKNGELSLPYSISLYSAGTPYGNDSYIKINKKISAPNQNGFNVVVLNDNFEVVSAGNF